jgi:hypothetical protein
MAEEQINGEYQKIRKGFKELEERECMQPPRRTDDVDALIEFNRLKISTDRVLALCHKIKGIKGNSAELEEILRLLTTKLKSTIEARNHLHHYRMKLGNIQKLLGESLEGRPKYQTILHISNDWKSLRKIVIDAPLYDVQMMKEYVVIDCLFRIGSYYFKRPQRDKYLRTKCSISSLISRWEVEDLFEEDKKSSHLLNNFLFSDEGGANRLKKKEKELFSQDDLDTNHSSNKKLITTSKLFRHRFLDKLVVSSEEEYSLDEMNFLGINRDQAAKYCGMKIQEGSEESRLMNQEWLESNQSDLNQETVVASKVEMQEAVGTVEEAQCSQPLAGSRIIQISDTQVTVIEPLSKACEKRNNVSFETLRGEAREHLESSLSKQYSLPHSKAFASRLESEIFSEHFSSIQAYSDQVMMCSHSITKLKKEDIPINTLMICSLDLDAIIQQSKLTKGRLKNPPVAFTSEEDISTFSHSHKSILDLDLQERAGERRHSLSFSEKSEGEKASQDSGFELLEAMAQKKEEEVKNLRAVLASIQKENLLLKTALHQIQLGLLDLNIPQGT